MKKILFFIPILLFAFAKVNVYVNKDRVYPGEEVVYTIEATGNNIKFPQINNIDNFPVQGTAVTQNITILNGNMQKTVSKSYIFFPTRSVTIPSFTLSIDNKTYKTKPIKITVTKPSQTKDKNFKIELSINKKNIHIEQPVIFKIKFYQKLDTNPQSIEIQRPNFQNFFTKLVSKKEYQKNGFDITEYTFLLIPQKTGNYKIGPILAKIGYLSKNNPFNEPFFNIMTSSLKYKNIFSNQLDLNVTPIPSNTIYGKFDAEFIADKTEVKANEPVKLKLIINGCGDFYDLPDFKLNIKDATVYENSPKIKTYVKNGNLCGTYTKTFTIISNKSYTIPSIEFKSFYNGKTHNIKTNQIYVKVKAQQKSHKALSASKNTKIEKKIVYKTKTNTLLLIIVFLIGVIVGFLISQALKLKRQNTPDLISQIKKANQKELFNLLLEYSYDPYIEKVLKQLEENIYNGKKHKINKKEIIKKIKNLKNS